MNNTQQLGNHGEDLVTENLKTNGYSILARNYSKRGGEIDIIAKKENTVVFVEVKTRKNPLFDSVELITPSKQRKIVFVAKLYLAEQNITDSYCRFDIALVEYYQQSPTITYIPDAFTESGIV